MKRWTVITEYRWLDERQYEEIDRRSFRWHWLARLNALFAHAGFAKILGRWCFIRARIVPPHLTPAQ